MVNALKDKKVDGFDLWHDQVGYPSSRVLELLSNVGVSFSRSLYSSICDVCVRAKQSISSSHQVIIMQLRF